MNILEETRLKHGLSLRQLSEQSGVSIDTLSRIENGRGKPQVGTLRKLSDALGVPMDNLVEELMKEEEVNVEELKTLTEKESVEIRWQDDEGRQRIEYLRFRGKEVDEYEDPSGAFITLYECPNGYRVHVDEPDDASLYPSKPSRYTDEVEYPTYTAEELVKEFPMFGQEVGIYPTRDID